MHETDPVLEARFAGARRVIGPDAGLDARVMADARRVLARQRWLGGLRGWSMAAAAGVVIGVGGWLVLSPMVRRPDMVDVLRAARAGKPTAEVARMTAAAVRVDGRGG